MDELGSYPRMQYHDNDHDNNNNTFTQNPDQNGSWFGLAISGLKFLINNQNNNNINHNLIPSQTTTNSKDNTSTSTSTKHHNSTPKQPQQKKLHILGPSVFKKQLYDIPEYQSTASSSTSTADKSKNMNSKSFKTNARLTKQALQQFNGNFSNYWNQRSSLHSHDMDEISNAGSLHTNHTNPKTAPLTDGGSSTVHQQTEEHHPSMTSSQIIHPTQDKQIPKLSHSRSFPLLHSAEYIQNFRQFSKDIMIPDIDRMNDEEGSQCNYIPSPPPISNTPDVFTNNGIMLTNIKHVHAIKSWESINSSNIESVHSFGDDDDEVIHSPINSDFGDGVLLTDSKGLFVSDNHFIQQKQEKQKKQKQQWLRKSLSAMTMTDPKGMKGIIKSRDIDNGTTSFDDTISCSTANTGIVHIHNSSKSGSEIDWTDCNETIKVISCPLPKSMKKNKKKSIKNAKKKRKYSLDEEEIVFSDWSNVSSNIGVTTIITPKN